MYTYIYIYRCIIMVQYLVIYIYIYTHTDILACDVMRRPITSSSPGTTPIEELGSLRGAMGDMPFDAEMPTSRRWLVLRSFGLVAIRSQTPADSAPPINMDALGHGLSLVELSTPKTARARVLHGHRATWLITWVCRMQQLFDSDFTETETARKAACLTLLGTVVNRTTG